MSKFIVNPDGQGRILETSVSVTSTGAVAVNQIRELRYVEPITNKGDRAFPFVIITGDLTPPMPSSIMFQPPYFEPYKFE